MSNGTDGPAGPDEPTGEATVVGAGAATRAETDDEVTPTPRAAPGRG